MRKFTLTLLLTLVVSTVISIVAAQELTTALSTNPPTLDPQETFNGFSFAVTNQIYETLFRVTPEGDIAPGLATAWEFIDPTTLEVTLREGVSFHDGTLLSAAAVAASLGRLLDPETGAPGRFVVSAIQNIDVVDDQTLRITTEEPFAPLLAHLAHPVTAIVPASQAEGLARQPVGTGPFEFVSWEQGNRILLEANPDYWGGEPAIGEVVYRIIPEVSTQLVELQSGGLDIVFNIPPDNFVSLQGQEGILTDAFLGWGSVHVGMNTENPKLQDPRVRAAVAHAIDKDLIIEEFLQGLAEPAVSPLPPTVRFSADLSDPYPYDPERARELLQEAGAEGLTLRLDIFQNPDLESVAQILQFMLSEAGIELEIRTQEYAAYAEAVQEPDTELYATTWGTVTLDADYTLYAFFHPSQIPENNTSRYNSARVTERLEQGRATPDDAVRADIYREVQETVVEDAPMVTLYYPLTTFAKRDALQGEEVAFSWINLDLRDATLEE